MNTNPKKPEDIIKEVLDFARKEKPAYSELYAFLEVLFLAQADAKRRLGLKSFNISPQLIQTKWQEGFPLLNRWDFPIDIEAAQVVLSKIQEAIPNGNDELHRAYLALSESLARHADKKEAVWKSFLYHEWEPWEEWVDTEDVNVASLLFLARSALRPSLEWISEDLVRRHPIPKSWLKGYCPICGSLPSLLFLKGEGERMAYCSWCGTQWGIYRLQCPNCDNRHHESLGYLYTEAEPHYRVHYCRLCRTYFKSIDTRERIRPIYFPLEEWTTLHLDLLAQRSGWKQPVSPSPVVYREGG